MKNKELEKVNWTRQNISQNCYAGDIFNTSFVNTSRWAFIIVFVYEGWQAW